METFSDWILYVQELLQVPLLKFGENQLTIWTLLYLLILLLLLFLISSKVKKWVTAVLMLKGKMSIGVAQAVGTIIRYVLLLTGFLVIIQTVGIDLTALNILAGALGIGVGFGLQNVVSNFVSSLIIMFERPIKVGDRIEVGDVQGDVLRIGGRSTTVITNDNVAIIVPNSKFVDENVINWSHTDPKVRFKIPVSVAYGSDIDLVHQLLLEVAKENSDVLEEPAPGVRFLEFGDNGLQFELRAWSSSLLHRRGRFVSALNSAIYKKFREHQIEFPFPQRDIHIRGGEIVFKQAQGENHKASNP